MSKTRNLSDLLDANGDVKSTALDNVPASDVVNDTTPQLGGDLASNGNNIRMADGDAIFLGTGNDLEIYHNASNSFIKDTGTGNLIIGANDFRVTSPDVTSTMILANVGGQVELKHNNATKLTTTSSGATVTGTLSATAFSGDGSALTNVPAGVSNVNTVTFTSSGTYTPTSGTKFIKVYATGGGGGGGGSTSNANDPFIGGGGSGANTAIRVYTATELGANASISIGSGGSGGGTTGGGSGGDTNFNPAGTGVTLSGTGGRGGEGTSINGRAGFNVSRQTSTGNSQYMHYGYFGKNGFRRNQASNEVEYSGAGGDSLFGRGGEPRTCNRNAAASVNGNPGFLGGGGSGSLINLTNGQSRTGGPGGSGLVVIEEFA